MPGYRKLLSDLEKKESRRGLFLKGINEKDQTKKMEEGQITSMTEDLMTGSKEGQIKEDKTKD